MSKTNWAVVVWLNNPEMTLAAVRDLIAQDQPTRVLLIGSGVSREDREEAERFSAFEPRCLAWFHNPGLLSLSATWNRGLDFCWEVGADEALVCNNDIRVTADTFSTLSQIRRETSALLVTATGVEGEEGLFEEAKAVGQEALAYNADGTISRGGPGFSCFLISRDCHQKYRFDEALIPAYCEDLDLHRRMMLGGDGDLAFGVNVRYLHLGGQTLATLPEARAEAIRRQVAEVCRPYYEKKWGGGANGEKFVVPFTEDDEDGALPDEQALDLPEWILGRWAEDLPVDTRTLFDEIRKGW